MVLYVVLLKTKMDKYTKKKNNYKSCRTCTLETSKLHIPKYPLPVFQRGVPFVNNVNNKINTVIKDGLKIGKSRDLIIYRQICTDKM